MNCVFEPALRYSVARLEFVDLFKEKGIFFIKKMHLKHSKRQVFVKIDFDIITLIAKKIG